MKVVSVGAETVGSVIGAHLVRAGEEAIFMARGQRAALVQRSGIILTGRANFTVVAALTRAGFRATCPALDRIPQTIDRNTPRTL